MYVGLRYSIPSGLSSDSAGAIRMYHYDTAGTGGGGPGYWYVDTNAITTIDAAYDSVTGLQAGYVSVRIPDAAAAMPYTFALMVDTMPPSITVTSDTVSAVAPNAAAPLNFSINDNVANVQVSVLAGPGDSA